jgi:hypothetical protein
LFPVVARRDPLRCQQPLQIESKSNTAMGSRPSNLDSSPSSSSVLTAGDDSLMPPHVEVEYELHMPILPQPRAYWRCPNATEYTKAHGAPGHLASFAGSSARSPAMAAAASSALADALVSTGGSVTSERVLTEASGLRLVKSIVEYEDQAEACELLEGELEVSGFGVPAGVAVPRCAQRARCQAAARGDAAVLRHSPMQAAPGLVMAPQSHARKEGGGPSGHVVPGILVCVVAMASGTKACTREYVRLRSLLQPPLT